VTKRRPADWHVLYDAIDPFAAPRPLRGNDSEAAVMRARIWRRIGTQLRQVQAKKLPISKVTLEGAMSSLPKWTWVAVVLLLIGNLVSGSLQSFLLAIGAMGLLGGFILAAASEGASTHQREKLKAELVVWERHYRHYYYALATTDIAELIIGEDLWQCVFAESLPALVKPLLAVPHRWHDRLLYASTLWDVVQDYQKGQRSGFVMQLVAAPERLRTLQAGDVTSEVSSSIENIARFAAIYDFFYGEQKEFEQSV
jgi:hypothetical protein